MKLNPNVRDTPWDGSDQEDNECTRGDSCHGDLNHDLLPYV